jgi:hypothetical protein
MYISKENAFSSGQFFAKFPVSSAVLHLLQMQRNRYKAHLNEDTTPVIYKYSPCISFIVLHIKNKSSIISVVDSKDIAFLF